jgi:hypothetical protein
VARQRSISRPRALSETSARCSISPSLGRIGNQNQIVAERNRNIGGGTNDAFGVLKVGWIPSAPPTVALSVVFSSVDHKQSFVLVLHDLPLVDQRRLVVAEVNLVPHTVSGIDDRFDCRVYDFPGVHVD